MVKNNEKPFKIKFTVDDVLDMEDIAPSSNRGVSVQLLNIKDSNYVITYKWSIDRISIVGDLKSEFVKDGNSFRGYTIDDIGMTLARNDKAIKKNDGWIIVDQDGENIAYINVPKYSDEGNKGRVDFNPNKLTEVTGYELKDFISYIFDNPHYSRCDVACDIINAPDKLIREYDFIGAVKTKIYTNQSRELETKYWGSPKSDTQIRLYNKFVEQTSKKVYLRKDIKTWWRLELQLKKGSIKNWGKVVADKLSGFNSPRCVTALGLKGQEKITLIALLEHPELKQEMGSRATVAKYNKYLKELSKHDEITQHLIDTFKKQEQEVKSQLDYWLSKIDITE